MSLALLIGLQAAAHTAATPIPALAAADRPVDIRKIVFDLSLYRPAPQPLFGCAPDPGGILVCGRRPAAGPDAAEMARLAKLYEQGPVDAETGLFGKVRGRVYTEEVAMPGGQVSKRVLVGIRLPF
ncbi:MAG: hypothetical protein QOH04_2961 [Sphingomonadales bacterium]|jgi:hypothetical protein|nr:hypothetical protein [Sphingomonadales bacterium]